MANTEETPLLRIIKVPPLFQRTLMEKLADNPPLPAKPTFSMPTFARAQQDESGRRLPQAIAHRGYKAKYPENTMGAFKGAVNAGANAIETDIHLSKDGKVVISHDATLKRCYGKDEKIIDCDWNYLSTLRTLKEPHEPMPRLKDLLDYLSSPGLDDIWLLLDIKLDNDPDDVIRLIAQTIQQANPSKRPWNERVVLGCWAIKYLPLCNKYLPNFPITHIGFSISYARRFLKAPNVSLNMFQVSLMGLSGRKFMREARGSQRPLFAWTVNNAYMMKWCIKKQLDGVVTDDPKKFLEISESYDEDLDNESIPWRTLVMVIWFNVLIIVFGFVFQWRHGYGSKRKSA